MMVRREFEGMKPLEKRIFERFLLGGYLKGEYRYNVKLYVPLPPEAEKLSEPEREFWREKIAKRIDAICETDTSIYIIEVTPRLSPRSIGEILMYEDLYKKQYLPTKLLQKIIVVEQDDPALHDLLKKNDIGLFVV